MCLNTNSLREGEGNEDILDNIPLFGLIYKIINNKSTNDCDPSKFLKILNFSSFQIRRIWKEEIEINHYFSLYQ